MSYNDIKMYYYTAQFACNINVLITCVVVIILCMVLTIIIFCFRPATSYLIAKFKVAACNKLLKSHGGIM